MISVVIKGLDHLLSLSIYNKHDWKKIKSLYFRCKWAQNDFRQTFLIISLQINNNGSPEQMIRPYISRSSLVMQIMYTVKVNSELHAWHGYPLLIITSVNRVFGGSFEKVEQNKYSERDAIFVIGHIFHPTTKQVTKALGCVLRY